MDGQQDQTGNSVNQPLSQQETQDKVVTKDDLAEEEKMKSKGNSSERRGDLRLKDLPHKKRLYSGSDLTKESSALKGLESTSRAYEPDVDANDMTAHSVPVQDDDNEETIEIEEEAYRKWTDYESFVADSISQRAGSRVKETLRTYNKHYLRHHAQEEIKKAEHAKYSKVIYAGVVKVLQNEKKVNGGKWCLNQADLRVVAEKRSVNRADLKAIKEMKKNKEILYSEKRIGHLPGISIAYQFLSRAEMVAVGLHSERIRGIDYIETDAAEKMNYSGPIAVAIVLSGQYEDDADYSNEIVYAGEGGNDFKGSKRQYKDQKMRGGNFALKNSKKENVPIRVIRGHNSRVYGRKIFTYCGLFKIVKCWREKGASGYIVVKYRLKRLLGQPPVDIEQVNFEQTRSNVSSSIPGLVCKDISFGEEAKPIPVTNIIQDPPVAPAKFKYITSIRLGRGVPIPAIASGCRCKGDCTDANTCSCARLNGSYFPYVKTGGGRLIEPKDVVYECGLKCRCGPGCINRVSQWKPHYRLEVYRTEEKGWAVRSWDFIPSGALVCEYIGILRKRDKMDDIAQNDYIFDIDCVHTMLGVGGRERRLLDASASSAPTGIDIVEGNSKFCIDAGSTGNVARFIDHSCEPNLFVQCVLNSHYDLRIPRIMLVAAENIPPMQELAYDYGFQLDSVVDSDGKVKELPCHCGSSQCRGRLY